MSPRRWSTRVGRIPRLAPLARDVVATLSSPVTRSIGLWVLASILVIEFAILVPSVLDRRDELVTGLDARNRYAAAAAMRGDPGDPLGAIASLPDVRGVALFDQGGLALGAAGEVPADGAMPAGPRVLGERVITSWPIVVGEESVTAIVALDAADLDRRLVEFGGRVIGLVLIIAVFVTGVTMAIVGTRVLRPLTTITRAVREARRTGKRETVDPHQPGEFSELVAHYNATINEQKEAERRGERLFYQAMHDPLTGLPNRALFSDRLQQAIERAERYGESAAVVLLDLDRFKLFNDTHGHAAGDELLRAVARRVRDVLRSSDTVARIGGDEFAVIEPRVDSADQCREFCERLRQALREPFEIGSAAATLSASIGVTLLPEDCTDSDTLIVNADLAMYRAKHAGGDRVCRFRRDMREDMVRRVTLEQALEEAVESEQFELYYQPIVDLHRDRVSSYEALVRWQHPEWGLIPPHHFLPVVEQTGMIVPLGDWVLSRAMRDLPELRARAPGCERVAVNVAAGQLKGEGADDLIRRALARGPAGPDALILEITESEVLDSPEATIEGLERAAQLGAMIAIDDFGTGYSSLAQVQDLPGHILKIDRRFVAGLVASRKARDLFAAVVSMGRSLGMQVVAEGVETPEQLEIVRASGCDRAQGFLLGRPHPLSSGRRAVDVAAGG